MTCLPESSGKKLGLVIDLDICVGCHACVTACKGWNDAHYGAPLSDPDPYGADRAVGIAQITEMPCSCGAGPNTGRDAIFFGEIVVVNSINAERAFLHHPRRCIHLARAIGARPSTYSAADAIILIDKDNAILGPLETRPRRADRYARGIVAM